MRKEAFAQTFFSMRIRKRKKLPREEKEAILLKYARKHIGKPYKQGARMWETPRKFSSAGLVQYLYKRIGVELPRLAIEQAALGEKVASTQKLKPGDLIFLRGQHGRYNRAFSQGVGHVAIYIGDDKVIHAAPKLNGKDGKVVEEPLREVIIQRGPITAMKRLFE